MVLLSTTAPEVLVKLPEDIAQYSMSFASILADGETISTVSSAVSDPTGLTITDSTIVGEVVTIKITGGTDGVNYRVKIIITTSLSNTYRGDGLLKVRGN